MSIPSSSLLVRSHSTGFAILLATMHKTPNVKTRLSLTKAESKIPIFPHIKSVKGFDSRAGFVTIISSMLRQNRDNSHGSNEDNFHLKSTISQEKTVFNYLTPSACGKCTRAHYSTALGTFYDFTQGYSSKCKDYSS